ncbi:MAG: 1-acyl-sn-glycerol-3-phosphate acyltransferase [Clostridia bacterium]|nr:1-acyl-sn-glycerol-3-phosphate acyltransferase [Clostridia bacterium]
MFRTISTFSYGLSRMAIYHGGIKKAKKLLDEGKVKEAEDFLMNKYVIKSLEGTLNRAGINIDVIGKENIPDEGPFVVMSNHQGNFDAVTVMYAMGKRRVGFIAKKELGSWPLIGDWLAIMGGIFIDRKNPREALKSIMYAQDQVSAGTPIAVFPEGTRSKSSQIGTFKTGVFKIVEKTKVPVIPVSIEGSYKLMEENNNKIKPGTINVTIGKPIDTKDFTKEDFRAFPDKVKKIIDDGRRPVNN